MTVGVVAQDEPILSVGQDSFPTIRCVIHVRATATGPGKATWLDAKLRFYFGIDRSRPVDSTSVPAEIVQQGWGKPDIQAGETPQSSIAFTANIPFGAGVVFRYRADPGGGVKTTEIRFDCGPAPSRASPPLITALTVETPTAPPQPGDTLAVDYSVTSDAGLWATILALSGPCDARWTYAEGLEHSVARVIHVPIPVTCRLGTPLSISISAFDAAALTASRGVTPGITLVDRTPPHVTALLFPPTGGSASEHLAGEYFVGDSLYFIYIASDNYQLRTLVWEVRPSGFRDSLAVSGQSASPWLKVPIRPDWTGPIQLRLYARDAAGLTSDTVASPLDSIRVFPTITRPTVSATVDGEIRDLAIDPRRGVLYLMQTNQQRILVMSEATLAVSDTIPLGGSSDLDLTAGGDSLIVALPSRRALGVIDLRQSPLAVTLLPLTALDTTTLDQRPWHVRVAASGKAFVALQGSVPCACTLLEVDLATGVERLRTDAGDAGNVGGGLLEASRDRLYLALNGGPDLFQAYDVIADAFGARGSAIPYDWRPSIDGTGQHVAVNLDIYDRALQFVRRVHSPILPGGAISTAFSGDGLLLYQGAGYSGIVRSRVSDGAMLDRSLTPFLPALIRVSPDGTMLIIVDSNCCATSRIATMDLR